MKSLFNSLRAALLGTIIFCCAQIFPGGFAPGTLVKVPGGYAAIETLKVGSIVCCCDKNANVIERPVLAIATEQKPTEYMGIRTETETIITSPQQKFFVHDRKKSPDSWVSARDLTVANHYLISVTKAMGTPVRLAKSLSRKDFAIMQPPALYDLCVAEGHNYFVTKQDFVVHNFLPVFTELFTTAMASSKPITLFQFGWQEVTREGITRWEFYYGFLTIKTLFITIAIGLFIYVLYQTFRNRDHDNRNGGGGGGGGGFRYQPSNDLFCPTATNFTPGKMWAGTHDYKGHIIVDEWHRQEHARQAAENHHREQERLDNAYAAEERRKQNEQLRAAELRKAEAEKTLLNQEQKARNDKRVQEFRVESLAASSC